MKFLYDMRALWPDERIDGGAWPQSNPLYRAIYRKFKRHQSEFIAHADAIVCLTSAAQSMLNVWPGRRPETPIEVIPCAADFDHFPLISATERKLARKELKLSNVEKVVTYLGSVGSWYLLEEMLDFFVTYRNRHPSARFLLVTPEDSEGIFAAARNRGVDKAIIVRSATREQVPHLLAASDLGLIFIRPVPSKRVSCPTKLGEMLASGLTIVANSGVGDVEEILTRTRGGVVINAFNEVAYTRAIAALETRRHQPAEVRRASRAWFDIRLGIDSYDRIYRQLLLEGPS